MIPKFGVYGNLSVYMKKLIVVGVGFCSMFVLRLPIYQVDREGSVAFYPWV